MSERDRLAELFHITHADAQLAGKQGFVRGWDAAIATQSRRNCDIAVLKALVKMAPKVGQIVDYDLGELEDYRDALSAARKALLKAGVA